MVFICQEVMPRAYSFFAPVINPYRQRVLTAAGAGAGVVAEEGLEPISSLLLWSSALAQGATLLSGLTANVQAGVTTTLPQPSWVNEASAPAQGDPVFSKLSLSPKRISCNLDVSSTLLAASDAEQLLINDLGKSLSGQLDRSVYHGVGGNAPLGIANHPDSVKILHSADWWVDICKGERVTGEADVGELFQSFATNPAGRETLRQATRTGATQPIWSEVSPKMVCTNAVQGLSVFCGCWQECVIGIWMLEIIVNPFSKAESGLVQLTGNLYCNVGLRYPNAFAMIS
jgi:hypothetical protein